MRSSTTSPPPALVSTLDFVGKGRFAVLMGVGGEGWIAAAEAVAARFAIGFDGHRIGMGYAVGDPYL